ncbi:MULTISPECIES: hypothetical protein [unclassified Bradyrhizobium]|uniref:hypothetical protein n=1 Tax=unclassified Bradyrhizobium TaxID=2631580 RepID=UPI001CD41AAB|nr:MULTISPECIES: hypothetical protein [unclassified Bradyrhizobium]MCA1378672.1 hypothetical protein [Bradyrhizobium sp. IC4060]MCA1487752.1 hypothetical protein [Bradyrhizobium sp. IC4061]
MHALELVALPNAKRSPPLTIWLGKSSLIDGGNARTIQELKLLTVPFALVARFRDARLLATGYRKFPIVVCNAVQLRLASTGPIKIID